MQPRREASRRTIACYTSPRSFEARTRPALRGLGYNLVPATLQGRFDDASWRPDMRIIEEPHLGRLPSGSSDPDTPIVIVAGPRATQVDDPRVVGRLQRPVSLVPLFRLIQRTLESHPRRVPRAPTQLPARCVAADQRWTAAVMSLSERGCLLKTGREISVGERLNVQFAVPTAGLVSARARCVSDHGDAVGLAFSPPAEETVRVISEFVSQRLATL